LTTWYIPVAVHAPVVGQDAAENAPARPLGLDCVVHAVPFHRSARVKVVVLVICAPTAVQSMLDAHDTPERDVWSAPAGLRMD
jgi:hypothetical protein